MRKVKRMWLSPKARSIYCLTGTMFARPIRDADNDYYFVAGNRDDYNRKKRK